MNVFLPLNCSDVTKPSSLSGREVAFLTAARTFGRLWDLLHGALTSPCSTGHLDSGFPPSRNLPTGVSGGSDSAYEALRMPPLKMLPT